MGVQQPSDCVPLRPIRSTQTDCDAVGTLICAPCPPGFIALLFAHDTEQTAAAFPCVSSIRPSKSTSGLLPRNVPSAAWTTSPNGIRPRPKPRLTMQVLTSPLRLRRVRRINAERSLRVQSETLLRPTTHSQGRGSCGRGPRLRLHCSASMPLSCAPPPPLRTRDHCRQPPHITPAGFPNKGKAQASAVQPGHCSLVERRLIPLRDPGVHWGLCNASAPKATYGIDPEMPQCPRLRDLHRPAADMPTGAAACQIGLRPI